MKRVYMMYTQEQQDRLVAALQKMGVIHLEEMDLEIEGQVPTEEKAPVIANRRRVENMLIKARGILDLFSEVDQSILDEVDEDAEGASVEEISKKLSANVEVLEASIATQDEEAEEEAPQSMEELSAQFEKEIEALEGDLKVLVSERRDLRDRQTAAEMLQEILVVSDELLPKLANMDGTVVPMIGEAKDATPILTEIMGTLNSQLGGRMALASKELDDNRFVLMVRVVSEYASLVETYLEEKGLRPVTLPPHVSDEFDEGVKQLRAEESSIPSRLAELDSHLADFAKKHASHMYVLTNALENRMAQYEAGSRFGYTEFTTLISGWVPSDELDQFKLSLMEDFPGIILEEDASPTGHHEIPVSLKQGKWARPYKVFLDMFGTPMHGTMDPTIVISIFFPIFFGLIVGDVGYGLIVLLAVMWGYAGFPGIKSGKKLIKNEGVRGALRIVRDGSIASIIFGLLFGEIFGLAAGYPEGGPLANIPLVPIGTIPYIGEIIWPFSRAHYEITLLNFTVAIGVIMVTLGFIHGITLAIRHKNHKELMAKLGLFASMIGMGLAIASLMGVVGDSVLYVGLGIFVVVGIPLCAIGGGFVVAMEAISPFVHVLSFARLMGFALAGAVLAELINGLMGTISGVTSNVLVGGIRLVLAILAGVFLHAFNLVLHVFEGSIQSARLHWVEYFGKFMLESLGGKPYEPFKEKKLSE